MPIVICVQAKLVTRVVSEVLSELEVEKRMALHTCP